MATGPTDWEKHNKGKAAVAFDRARSGQAKQAGERVDSQQVKKTAPGMNGPTPPQNARNAMARQSHQKDMRKDDQRAKEAAAIEKRDAIRARQEKTPEKRKDKDHER